MSAQHYPGGLTGKDPADMSAVELQAVVYALRDQRNELLAVLDEAGIVLAEKLRRLGADKNASPTIHRIRAVIVKVKGGAA